MKTTMYFLKVLMIALFVSCGSDDDGNNPGSNGSFFAKVNGQDYNPTFVTAFNTTITNTVLVSGSMSNGEELQLFIPADITTGTYNWSDINEAFFVQGIYTPAGSDDANDSGFADTGSLTITSVNQENKTMQGTFSFVSDPTVNGGIVYTITEGSFSVTYTDL